MMNKKFDQHQLKKYYYGAGIGKIEVAVFVAGKNERWVAVAGTEYTAKLVYPEIVFCVRAPGKKPVVEYAENHQRFVQLILAWDKNKGEGVLAELKNNDIL